MKFGRRLRLYIFGVLLGCLIAFGIFNKRLHILTDWLPNHRVLALLQKSDAHYTHLAQCQLDCFKLDSTHVEEAKTNGVVRFKYSETRVEPKKYVVDWKHNDEKIRMTFSIADSTATLAQVEMPEKVVICNCE